MRIILTLLMAGFLVPNGEAFSTVQDDPEELAQKQKRASLLQTPGASSSFVLVPDGCSGSSSSTGAEAWIYEWWYGVRLVLYKSIEGL